MGGPEVAVVLTAAEAAAAATPAATHSLATAAASAAATTALSVAQARQQSAAARKSQEAAAEQLQARRKDLARRAQIQKKAVRRQGAQLRGRARVAFAGESGTESQLIRQIDADTGLNISILDANRLSQAAESLSIFNAQVSQLESRKISPVIAGFTGALEGISTGLSIANAGVNIVYALNPVAGGSSAIDLAHSVGGRPPWGTP